MKKNGLSSYQYIFEVVNKLESVNVLVSKAPLPLRQVRTVREIPVET